MRITRTLRGSIVVAVMLTASLDCRSPDSVENVGTQSAAVAGVWAPTTTNLGAARYGFGGDDGTTLAPVLSNGDVFFVCGQTASNMAVGTTETYTDTGFLIKAQLPFPRAASGIVTLTDGTVLVAGGGLPTNSNGGVNAVTNANIWNPTSQAWTNAGSLVTARYSPPAVRLTDGRVLIVGGGATNTQAQGIASAELYSSITNQFTLTTGSLPQGRTSHQSALLPNGGVVILGGSGGFGIFPRALMIFDPTTQLFTTGPDMLATSRVSFSATRLPDGRILYCDGSSVFGSAELGTCEIYDGATNTVSSTGSMGTARSMFGLITLPTGKVLALGGTTGGTTMTLASAEIYDPASGAWSATGAMGTSRISAAMALLKNGTVLVAGGGTISMGVYTVVNTAEIYDPGLALNCEIPQINGTTVRLANGTACAGGTCQNGVCTPIAEAGTDAAAESGSGDGSTEAGGDAGSDANSEASSSDGGIDSSVTDTGTDASVTDSSAETGANDAMTDAATDAATDANLSDASDASHPVEAGPEASTPEASTPDSSPVKDSGTTATPDSAVSGQAGSSTPPPADEGGCQSAPTSARTSSAILWTLGAILVWRRKRTSRSNA